MDTVVSPTPKDVVQQWSAAIAKGDLAGAKTIVTEGIDAFPDNGKLIYHLAVTEHRLGSMSDAMRHGFKAVSMDSKDAGSLLFLSTLLMQNGFVAGARSQAMAALDASPDQTAVHLRLSEIALKAGDVQGAHHWADKAIASGPQNAAGYLCRANVHLQVAEYDYADMALHEAARLEPENAAIRTKLAVLDAIRGGH